MMELLSLPQDSRCSVLLLSQNSSTDFVKKHLLLKYFLEVYSILGYIRTDFFEKANSVTIKVVLGNLKVISNGG